MGEPRTTREALVAQMLGELDGLLTRVEQVSKTIAEAEVRIATTVQVRDQAGDKYRSAVASCTADAKVKLTEHLQHGAAEMTAYIVEKQRTVRQEAARTPLQAETARYALQPEASLEQRAQG